jgi:3-(3-hydroxy-phenyl)propionate hydroxylase
MVQPQRPEEFLPGQFDGGGAVDGASGLHADVAIIGFGPVGAVLAGLLGKRGLRVTVIEREHDIFGLPRAAHVDHTGLRTIQELGCLDLLLPTMLPNPGLDFVTGSGQLLIQVPGNQTSVSDLPASMYFYQPVFDRALRGVIAGMPNVSIHLGTEATGFRDEGDAVVVTARGPDGGTRQFTASWVVGCDGSWSPVRESLGIELEDLDFEERWLVADIMLGESRASLPARAVTVCDPARPFYSIPMPGLRHRFEFMLLDSEDAGRIQQPEVVDSLIRPCLGDSQADIERSAVYTFHGLVARKWRLGRMLIAGDAAHQMPPFLGQGMCSGIRDAANLAWKLHRVVRGMSPETLLDTYTLERRPHVATIIEAAIRFGRVICTVDPVAAAERDRAFLADPAPPAERIPFGLPVLEPGPLVLKGGGELFIQPSQPEGEPRFDDIVGERFLVVGRTREQLDSASWWSEQVGAMVAPLEELGYAERALRRWMDVRKAGVVVVRPDRYVLAVGRDLGAITSEVSGILSVRPFPALAVADHPALSEGR